MQKLIEGKWYLSPIEQRDMYGVRIPCGPFLVTSGRQSGRDGLISYRLTSWNGQYLQPRVIYATVEPYGGRKYDWYDKVSIISDEDSAKIVKAARKQMVHDPGNTVTLHNDIQMGTDPEVFVQRGNGEVFPAFEFLQPEPAHKITDSPYSSTDVQPPYWDGFQAEFNVAPFSCIAGGTDRIQHKLQLLHDLATGKDKNATLIGNCVKVVQPEVLAAAKDEHVKFGCKPSSNAYGLSGETADGRSVPVRFAGVHIHFNFASSASSVLQGKIQEVVRSIDNIAGVMSVAVIGKLEDPIRRRFYGLAGEYRTPSYGLEYRALSSAMLWHPAMVHLHFNFARAAAQMVRHDFKIWDATPEETIDIINNLNIPQARKALRRNRVIVEGLLRHLYIFPHSYLTVNADQIFDGLLMKGVREHIDLDMTKNWHLDDQGWRDQCGAPCCTMYDFAQKKLSSFVKK